MSNRHKAKHNTTRSKNTSDTRPKGGQKQVDKYEDMTGASNEHHKLNSNSNRGQTLGSGPWGKQQPLPEGFIQEPWLGSDGLQR